MPLGKVWTPLSSQHVNHYATVIPCYSAVIDLKDYHDTQLVNDKVLLLN